MLAVTPRSEWTHVCEQDKDAEVPTVFKFRDITQRERLELFGDEGGFGKKAYAIVQASLVGVEAFPDADGKDVAFASDRAGKAADDFLARIPWQIMLELAGVVIKGSELESEEVEKSAPLLGA
tara:strand:- start:469 stop:837 length:369 start_codon:yes stop_codon:yes gene_type:complete